MKAERTPLTLCMIVRNEAAVIARCLHSVKPLVTSWIVVDTGSSDGTQEIVRQRMADLPGALLERPWRDFATNRNEALAHARELSEGGYVLVVDADDTIEVEPGRELPPLTADAYALLIRYGGYEYWRTQIFRSSLDYEYEGPVHEVLVSKVARDEQRLPGLACCIGSGGARSLDSDKFRKDALVLQRALEEDPSNARYAFYLGQSWRDAGESRLARESFRLAAELPGWDEQAWCARLEIAKCTERLRDSPGEIVNAYLAAYEARPGRAEPLCYLAMHLRVSDRICAAYPFAHAAATIPYPDGDRLFIDATVYAWRARDELAVSAYWVGRYEEGLEANRKLLASKVLPAVERTRVAQNFNFCLAKIGRT